MCWTVVIMASMKVSTAGRLYRIRLYRYMMNKLQRDSMLHIHWAAACIL